MERAARRHRITVLFAVLAAAALLRLPALRTEPWLDEVWSIGLARRAATVVDALFRLHDDNSNPLNTLYLRLVSESRNWADYRLLSLAAGLLTVALLGWDEEDPARGLLAAALAAVSTSMVLYATEARGYALMTLFALACFRLLRPGGAPSRARAAAFGACAFLAFLSHPTFVYVYAALFLWAAAKLPRAGRVRGLLALFAAPTVAYGLFEALQFPMTVGGADVVGFGTTVRRTLDLWSGAPESVSLAGAALLLGLLAWELRNLHREKPDEFVFFAALFAGACAFVAIFPFRFERHFFACLPFALLLAAGGLMRLGRAGGAKRALAAALVLLFVAGNGLRDQALASAGRGHYEEAVRRMGAETPGSVVAVGSDHDARNRLMLDFYAGALPPAKRIEYIPFGRWAEAPPEWFLLHGFSTDPRVAPTSLSLKGFASYELVEIYPYAGLSGWTWMLYRRAAPGDK